MENQIIISTDELGGLIYNKFIKAGYPLEQAQEMTNHLVYADSIGLGSHGCLRVRYNILKLKNNGVNINPDYQFIENTSSSAILDAQNSNGLYAVNKAMEYGIIKAKENGIYMINVKNITHSGAMSYYVRKAADNNLIGITMCCSDSQVLPVNGKKPYFGTNPIAYAIPTKNDPIIFDMATSVQAVGKIFLADLNNESIPADWAVDVDGNPTTDPRKAAYSLPVGGAKGYGLGLLVDVLSAVLTNLNFGKNIKPFEDSIDSESGLGQMIILINPAVYSELSVFLTNMSRMVDELHDIEPYDTNKPVLVPGESSKAKYEKHQKEGVPISKKVYEYLLND